MKIHPVILSLFSVVLLAVGCATSPSLGYNDSSTDSLIGAWRGKIQFKSGAFATVKNLEFMYVFNAGGTMTESSNYDASPPVPPAYGVWRKISPLQYEAKYTFYATKAPKAFEDIAEGGGWSPGGWGVLTEKITLAADGKSFDSTIRYDGFDETGKATETGSEAGAHVVRMGF